MSQLTDFDRMWGSLVTAFLSLWFIHDRVRIKEVTVAYGWRDLLPKKIATHGLELDWDSHPFGIRYSRLLDPWAVVVTPKLSRHAHIPLLSWVAA